jgi:hypothetical protein
MRTNLRIVRHYLRNFKELLSVIILIIEIIHNLKCFREFSCNPNVFWPMGGLQTAVESCQGKGVLVRALK